MRQHILFLTLLTVTLTGCQTPLQGPEADLHAIATPDPVRQDAHFLPKSPPGPTPDQGQFRAWVPRDVSPNGDISEGHWLIISTTPPAVEMVEPARPMPRAPKLHIAPKPAAPSAPQVPVQPQAIPQVTPTPMLPTGALRGSQTPPLRSLLGGQ
jgi:hypothetical protein